MVGRPDSETAVPCKYPEGSLVARGPVTRGGIALRGCAFFWLS